MKFNTVINLTWSKLMAFLILGCAVYLDVRNGGETAFMFCIPFVVALIGVKQYLDRNKTEESK
jgi:hypothetical protein